jgi:hypothetical protein
MAGPSITPELAKQIDEAIEAIPISHREAPVQNEIVVNPGVAFQRLQDWAFTQGYAFVIASKVATRVRFDCIHHKNATRNTRKTEEVISWRLIENASRHTCEELAVNMVFI